MEAQNIPNHFRADFKWLKFVDAAGNLVYSTIDSFLIARRNARGQNGNFLYPQFNWPEFALRLEEMNDKFPNGSRTGDIIFFPDGYSGYMSINDGDEFNGWHGGASESESFIPLFLNIPGDVVDKGFIQRAVDAAFQDIRNKRRYLRNWELGKILKAMYQNLGR